MSAVYFAHADGRIKVGVTAQPVTRRLSQISAHLPDGLKLIAAIPGDLTLERTIHKRLSAHKISGEWFRDCEGCRGLIHDLVAVSRSALLSEPLTPKGKAVGRRVIVGFVKLHAQPKPSVFVAELCGCSVRTAERYVSGEIDFPTEVYIWAMNKLHERE